MTKTIDEIKSDLAIALTYIRFAIEEARKTGIVGLGILSINPDGSGRIECKFTADFIDDVAIILDLPPLSDEDRGKCRDKKFMDLNFPELT